MSTPTPASTEARVQVALMIVVGAVSAAFSWSHVLDLAAEHGQRDWRSWVVAACIETGAVAGGLEVRRRKRHAQPVAAAVTVVVGMTVLQLAAQIDQAQRDAWGVIVAAVPAVTFLTLVKLALAAGDTVTAQAAADTRRVRRQSRHRDTPAREASPVTPDTPAVTPQAPPVRPHLVTPQDAQEASDLDAWVKAQRDAGRRRKDVLEEGMQRFGVSESTMERRWRDAAA